MHAVVNIHECRGFKVGLKIIRERGQVYVANVVTAIVIIVVLNSRVRKDLGSPEGWH